MPRPTVFYAFYPQPNGYVRSRPFRTREECEAAYAVDKRLGIGIAIEEREAETEDELALHGIFPRPMGVER